MFVKIKKTESLQRLAGSIYSFTKLLSTKDAEVAISYVRDRIEEAEKLLKGLKALI